MLPSVEMWGRRKGSGKKETAGIKSREKKDRISGSLKSNKTVATILGKHPKANGTAAGEEKSTANKTICLGISLYGLKRGSKHEDTWEGERNSYPAFSKTNENLSFCKIKEGK